MQPESILRRIHIESGHRDPVLVAIEGPGGAGKTTLAEAIQNGSKDVVVIHHDDFYRPMDEMERRALSPQEGYERYFDWQRLLRQLLLPLRRGEIAQYQIYDWMTGDVGKEWVYVYPRGIILVEGVYTMRPELFPYYDFTIFVDTDEKTRYKRVVERDGEGFFWIRKWMEAENWYLEHWNPRDRADLVVNLET